MSARHEREPPPDPDHRQRHVRLGQVASRCERWKTCDYYCVDNLPAELLPSFVQQHGRTPSRRARNWRWASTCATVASDLSRIGEWLSAVGALGYDHRLVFFDTSDEVLLKRYSETRRRHPLSHQGLPLSDAIALEREACARCARIADYIIDTSQTQRAPVAQGGAQPSSSRAMHRACRCCSNPSPTSAACRGDADFVFDARCLPNPHWDPRCGPCPAATRAVRDYLDATGRRPRIRRPGVGASSTPGCRASSRKRAATSPSPSAAPAAAIARSTWRKNWPSISANATAKKY